MLFTLDKICMSKSLGSRISIQKQPSLSRSENTLGPSVPTPPPSNDALLRICGSDGASINPAVLE